MLLNPFNGIERYNTQQVVDVLAEHGNPFNGIESKCGE